MGLLDILKQYTGSPSGPTGDVAGHFDTVAQHVSPNELGGGIAAAMRSDATPSFGQTVGGLFGKSNPEQQAGLLSQLVQAVGPGALSSIAGGALGGLFGAGRAPGPITPAQASQVTPDQVTAIANHAEQQDGSIVDKVGGFYAQHPAIVKTLGVAALAIAMSHMNKQQ